MLQQSSPSSYSIISTHDFAEVREHTASLAKSLHSIRYFKEGDVLCQFGAAAILKSPTYLTVQTGLEEHIHLKPEFLKFINHSCDPNVFFDTYHMQLVCLRPIEPGDEFGFFYPSTEWDMAQPFSCLCGSHKCLNQIRGAAHIPLDILNTYKVTRFIQQQIHERSIKEKRA